MLSQNIRHFTLSKLKACLFQDRLYLDEEAMLSLNGR
jgi:hypothetical protein